MKTINQRMLRNKSGQIMRSLDRGERFLITRNGVPVGELRPFRQRFIAGSALKTAMSGSPPIDAARFRRDVDAVVDQDIEPLA